MKRSDLLKRAAETTNETTKSYMQDDLISVGDRIDITALLRLHYLAALQTIDLDLTSKMQVEIEKQAFIKAAMRDRTATDSNRQQNVDPSVILSPSKMQSLDRERDCVG